MESKQKRARKSYSNELKLSVVKRYLAGEPVAQISATTGVPVSNISKWKGRTDLESAVPHHKKARAPDEPELDACMVAWVKDMRQAGAPLTETNLCLKALEFATKLKITDFKHSRGWVEKFKERHKISAKVRKINF